MNFFDYFQIASVAVFLLLFVGRASYSRFIRNINPIAIGRGGRKGFLLAVELVAVIGLICWIIEVLRYALHSSLRIYPALLDSQLVSSLAVKSIGVALVTLSLVLFGLAFVSFGDSWRVGFDVRTPGALVTKGVFTASRNPIYVCLDLWFIGIFLINGTLIFLIFALLAVAFLHWQILQEEEFLLRLYGQPYQSYCAKTGRYLYW
jgi:protein-S-isoprenylcysteine O-methyltransferase Ste14